MRLLAITKFSDDDTPNPERIQVEMSIEEASLIALLVGRMSPNDEARMLGEAQEIGAGIYDCLIGHVINRYWEDGLDALVPRTKFTFSFQEQAVTP